jgi:uncharacterized protein (TIGR03118 family)
MNFLLPALPRSGIDSHRGRGHPAIHSVLLAIAASIWCAQASAVDVIDLITNDNKIHPAPLEDGNLQNAWGVSYLPGGPFWVSDNGSGKSTVYTVNGTTNAAANAGIVVTIPGDGSVTGQAANNTSGFNGDRFLFVSEDGTVSGWRSGLGTSAETLQIANASNVYKGAALATIGSFAYLYAANFASGKIDVFKGSSNAPDLIGKFTDPNLPSGYAPFNVADLDGTVYVSYAQQSTPPSKDEVSGAGHGFVDAYSENGVLLRRVATQGTLNSPWGMVIAPSSFGAFAGDLLVGNFGDGRISVYDSAGHFLGQLTKGDGSLVQIDGLWALILGNGGLAGSGQKIYFSAGPDDEVNGIFGVLLIPEPSALAALSIGLFAVFGIVRRRVGACLG